MNEYLAAVAEHFRTPDRLFAILVRGSKEIPLSWRDFERSAQSFLAAYRQAGVGHGGTILLFLRHVPELYGSFFGAMLGGFVPSFMPCTSPRQDPKLYWSSHRTLLERIAPSLIVADRATLDEMRANGLDGFPTLDIASVAPAEAEWSIPSEDQIALLQHSSGTTGLKKGVALSYRAIERQVGAYAAALDLSGADIVASWLPLYHDMGLIACLVTPVSRGVPIIQLDPFDWVGRPGQLLDIIARHKATLCWLPNFAFEHIAALAGPAAHDVSSVRAFVNCSEPCKPRSMDRFVQAIKARPEQLHCCYAMAETVFAITQTTLGDAPRRISVRRETLEKGSRIELDPDGVELVETGTPIQGVVLSIHDEDRQPLDEGHVGEIAVQCPFLFDGYNQDPERTARRLSGGTYFTGDLGFLHNGRLYVLGRLDDLIIVAGRNLYAHELEALVSGIEGVKGGRVVALPEYNESAGTQGVVIVAERRGTRPDAEVSRDIARAIQSTVNIAPRAVHLVGEGWLVKTSSGKVSRSANLQKLRELQGAGATA